MRLLTILLLAFSLQISASSKNQVANGNLTYGKEVFNSLQVNGFVTLNGTTITQRLQVNGSVTASNAQVGELNVNGQASLSHCIVKDKSTVTGSLNGSFSTFEDAITLTSDLSVFDGCSLTSLKVLKTKDDVTQKIELKGKTKIIGLITFESGTGQVVACHECQIKPESVIGGKLIKR
ncbi:MAG TPA: hypothetical protein VMR37_06645 [Rhabdochlamydiaceae bacterium]|jgi:hypothetical protein|nr:hypothetical protein [Rhabdochlamydiaceae bacterium]